jgi:hypothetical protein
MECVMQSVRFLFRNSAIQTHSSAAGAAQKIFLKLAMNPTVELDAATEILIGEHACTLLLENDANREANQKVIASFDAIMQMTDQTRQIGALREMLESIRNSPYRSYFLFFDTTHEQETPIEFSVNITCVGSITTKAFDERIPLAPFTCRDGAHVTHSNQTASATVSLGGTARKSIINGFAMLCVQTICIEGWTPASVA